jgi:hypothetical protein
MVFFGLNRSINFDTDTADSSSRTISSSSAESTNTAVFNLVFPKSKQIVTDANPLHLGGKSSEMRQE